MWSSVSSSQRILSLWLERLSTDRIARQWREVAFSPRRLRQARQPRSPPRGRRRGGAARIERWPRAGAGPRHASDAHGRAGGSGRRRAPARRHCRLVPALHAARRRRSARRHSARHRRLRASLRRRGEASRRSPRAGDGRSGFSARAAIAATIGAASAAARFGDAAITASGGERDLLSPLPLAALRLPGETVAALARVGLKRIGDILDLPRAPLAARFGADLLRQLDRALGARRRTADPASAGRALCRGEELSRADRARGGRARDRRAARGAAQDDAGGARRRRAPPRACPLPHRWRGQAHRGRHLATAARSASDPRALRRAAGRASATRSIRASASIWRGSRCSTPSPVRTSRSASADAKIRPSSTASSIA